MGDGRCGFERGGGEGGTMGMGVGGERSRWGRPVFPEGGWEMGFALLFFLLLFPTEEMGDFVGKG